MGWINKIFGGNKEQASKQASEAGSSQAQVPTQASPTSANSASEASSQPGSSQPGSSQPAVQSSAAFSQIDDDRIDASIERLGWGEGTAFKNRAEGQGYWLLFGDVAALVTVGSTTGSRTMINVMGVMGNDKPIPKKRMIEALTWVNMQNNRTRFGTCLLGESVNGLSLRVSCPIVIPVGATDEQLDSWLYNAVSCALQSAKAANDHFFAAENQT